MQLPIQIKFIYVCVCVGFFFSSPLLEVLRQKSKVKVLKSPHGFFFSPLEGGGGAKQY